MRTALRLPRKPSALLKVALCDLKACERDPEYTINMSYWHRPNADGRCCEVCFAGTIMAQRSGASIAQSIGSTSFDKATEDKFNWLNYLRMGISYCMGDMPDITDVIKVLRTKYVPHSNSPTQFKKWVKVLIRALEIRGQ
ncbi:hypothetical protein LCGC14_0392260 [marine sediment metagenome]|uniref:Uncharacterized protein n=1 Tax=marine sediment metagenome TaxID=412755 RepID=A0A0F9THC6_9ZZZZ